MQPLSNWHTDCLVSLVASSALVLQREHHVKMIRLPQGQHLRLEHMLRLRPEV
jgi:hypothetical protein